MQESAFLEAVTASTEVIFDDENVEKCHSLKSCGLIISLLERRLQKNLAQIL